MTTRVRTKRDSTQREPIRTAPRAAQVRPKDVRGAGGSALRRTVGLAATFGEMPERATAPSSRFGE